MKKNFFGFSEDKIRETFREEESKPNNNPKIEPYKTTLATLSEGSKELLKENPEFLKDIYQ